MNVWHALPVDDLRPHEDSIACACQPRVIDYPAGRVVIHNSWDGREIFERALDAAFAERN